ncbi:hypothetical protein ABK040_008599 [Willaertia magna]
MSLNLPKEISSIPDTDLSPIVDQFNNKLLIPTKKINYTHSLNDFEIYLAGNSTKGGLMIGKPNIISNDDKKEEEKNSLQNSFDVENNDKIWPNLIKFTRETIPIPLQQDEYVEFVSCGIQHLVLATNFSKCYLFGDYIYGNNSSLSLNFIFGHPLPFDFNNNLNNNDKNNSSQLNCKITHLDGGEQFVIVKDELNRFWYSGKFNFGNGMDKAYYEFLQLGMGHLLNNDKITRVIAGGRHAAVCVDDRFIYSIGSNSSGQLGNVKVFMGVSDWEKKFDDYYFVKTEWNLNGEYFVKELACSGYYTLIMTKCGKLFKTTESGPIEQILTDIIEKPLTIGTDWTSGFILLQNGKCYKTNDGIQKENVKMLENFNLNSELKLSCGTGYMSSCYALYSNDSAKFAVNVCETEIVSLKPNLPIVHIKTSGEINLVYCCKKKVNVMQQKLHETKGLFDINFIIQ